MRSSPVQCVETWRRTQSCHAAHEAARIFAGRLAVTIHVPAAGLPARRSSTKEAPPLDGHRTATRAWPAAVPSRLFLFQTNRPRRASGAENKEELSSIPSSFRLPSGNATMAGALPLLLALCCCTVAVLAGAANAAAGRKTVGVYELKAGDFSVRVTNWGATITSVVLPDSRGNLADVVLGYDTIAQYVNGSAYFGALVGRVANRVANARFVLDGKVYHLYANDGKNALHGGHRGFSKVIWTVKEYVGGGDSPHITLYYHSFDGEEGFPGDLDVYVTYHLSSPYVLSVHMNATAVSKATPVNLAQHTYWNLGGAGSGDVLRHTVQLFASRYTPVDGALIPTGRVAPVAGTPYDLRAPTPVGAHVRDVYGGKAGIYGYDTNYAVDGEAGTLRKVAVVRDSGASGRAMELWANQPGVQFYTGNFLDHVPGKGGKVYGQYGALCLETQGFPDAVNHPNFPSVIVRPGGVYNHDMIFKFSF